MNRIRYWSKKFYRRAIQEVGSRFYVNPDSGLRNSIIVAGTARSGTTWLGDLIASQVPSRIMFEPFNPNLVPEYRSFHYFQYMRPGTENPKFGDFAQKIFSGEIRNRWINSQNERIYSKVRLVKEIRINLALKWLHDNFPDVPIIFLLRHPCAVVMSRINLKWATDRDIESFVSQPELVDDHLAPYIGLIKNAGTIEEKHAIIWSVSNLVPLQQFGSNEIKIVYYENLCTQPEIELPAIFNVIGRKYKTSKNSEVNRPSQTAQATSAVVDGADKISSWRRNLNTAQVKNILRIVDAFGLGHVYGDALMPLSNNAN